MIGPLVTVVGGGPAGSIAAKVLADAGVDVMLLEKGDDFRDKVCGDALIPDALTLLTEVGLMDEVQALGHSSSSLQMYSPSGDFVRLAGDFLTVRRSQLDDFLRQAAARAGAKVRTGVTAVKMVVEDDCARIETADGETIRSQLVILATGANSKVLKSFKLECRTTPSALAGRAYYRLGAHVPEDVLFIWYERPVLPGYGWIFPMGDHVFNVGAGLFLDKGKPPANLLTIFDKFVRDCPGAVKFLEGAEQLSEFKGAPLRCGLQGSDSCGDRLIAVGETVGTTYSLTGEGLGKAMVSGRMAAELGIKALESNALDRENLSACEKQFKSLFGDRFKQYNAAQDYMRYPWILNLLVRKSARNSKIRSVLEDSVSERKSVAELLSIPGLLKMVFSRDDRLN